MNRRAITITAFISVLLNILLIGVIAGHIYSGFGGPHHRMHSKGMESILAKLPEEKVQWYKDALRASRENRGETFKEIKKIRLEAVDILVAEQFDAAAFKQKLQQLDGFGAGFKQQQMTILVQFAEQLNANERRSLSKILLKDKGFKNKQR